MYGGQRLWNLIVLAASILMLSAQSSIRAADLGGDCCADLEERISELEATAARKGNRKVSLTISGWVSQQLYYFDDGRESNVYVVDKATDLASHVLITGSAQITNEVKAGYTLALFMDPADSLLSSQDGLAGVGTTSENSYWWLQNDHYGKVSVGHQSGTGDNWAILTDFTGTLIQANTVTFDGPFMKLRVKGADGDGYGQGLQGAWQGFLWCETVGFGIAGDCAGLRTNSIRYDSPTIAGFAGSASWGDNMWSIGVKYDGEAGGFRLSTGAAYTRNTEKSGALGIPVVDSSYFQYGLTVKHLASNLWFHGVYGHEEDTQGVPNGDHYYLKAGWSPTLNSLGTTHIYGEFGQNLNMYGDLAESTHPGATCTAFGGTTGSNIASACALDNTTAISGSTVTRYGVGLVQDVDAAAMSFWLNWRMHELNADFANSSNTIKGKQDFVPLQMFLAGALINF